MSSSGEAILLVANQGRVGGGEVMLHRLALSLRELGRGVTVAAPQQPSEVADLMAAEGFEVQRVRAGSRRGYLLGLCRHRRGSTAQLYWCNGLLPGLALAGRSRRVVHLHQKPVGPAQRALSWIARRGARAVVVPSRWLGAQTPGSCVLPNWVPEPEEPARSGSNAVGADPDRSDRDARRTSLDDGEQPPLQVGFLGRLSADKGVLDLLDAVRMCEREAPGSVRLRLSGDFRFVPRAQVEAVEQAAAGAGGIVELAGWQPREEALRAVDLLVVPSLQPESFGLVAAEAMAAGVPVLVSDAGALPEVVGPQHPLIVPAGDTQALAEGIRRAGQLDLAALAQAQRERWLRLWSPHAGRRNLQDLLSARGI